MADQPGFLPAIFALGDVAVARRDWVAPAGGVGGAKVSEPLKNGGAVLKPLCAQTMAWNFFCRRTPLSGCGLMQKVPRQGAWRGTFPWPAMPAQIMA
jgi:hypothetical protein